MAFIYKITNQINDKLYIGKTYKTIEQRFKEHCKASKNKKTFHRPLYSAMNKYGIDKFQIELIEETDIPEEREQYWIKYYDSYKNGYNATLGGDGKPYIDHQKVVELYKVYQNQKQVSNLMNIDEGTVRTILREQKVEILSSPEVNKKALSKKIAQLDLEGNVLNVFDSAIEAARQLGKITSTSNGASSHITDVCRGKRKTAYHYKWKFVS
jgi:group I intron endonuclease